MYTDLFWASRRRNTRARDPYHFYRLGTFADSANAALPEGTLLLAADRDTRASLRIGCDRDGNGGSPIGAGPAAPNPSAWEIFRCNDHTLAGRQNWSPQVGDADEAARRANLLHKDPFTAQTAIAASYGLLQVMYGRAIDEGWASADGARNPSLLFDLPGAAARGEGSLVAGAAIVRRRVLEGAKRGGAAFPPTSPDELLAPFVPAWQRYNPGQKGYAEDVASRTTSFIPRPSVPVIAP